MWKSILLAAAVSVVAAPAFAADTLKFEPDHTYVLFRYNHFGMSQPPGKIMGVSGTLVLDSHDPTQDTVDLALDMNTLTTGLPDFDTQLKGKDYFDVAQFPQATFKSTKVEMTGDNTANVTGDLTLHGVTKSVVLAVTFTKKAFNPAIFKTGYGFSATAKVDRGDFGVSKYEPFIGGDIELEIGAEVYP